MTRATAAARPVRESEDARRRSVVPTRLSSFRSFDGQAAAVTWHQRPDRYRQLEASDGGEMPRIARGAGLSYAPASFGSGVLVLEMTRFSRILDFAESSGSVRVEAGASIGDLLSLALARGRYLPVVPGHPDITVGGCIAADVHGQNPGRDGTLSRLGPRVDALPSASRFRHDLRHGATRALRGDLRGLRPDRDHRRRHPGTAGAAGAGRPPRAPSGRVARGGGRSDSRRLRFPSATAGISGLRGTRSIGPGLVFLGDWTDAPRSGGPRRRAKRLTAVGRGVLPVCLWNPVTAAAAARAFDLASRHPVPAGHGPSTSAASPSRARRPITASSVAAAWGRSR